MPVTAGVSGPSVFRSNEGLKKLQMSGLPRAAGETRPGRPWPRAADSECPMRGIGSRGAASARRRALAVACAVLSALLQARLAEGALKPDEEVTLFPALGWQDSGGRWTAGLHGVVFEGGERPKSAAVFGRVLGIDVDELSADEKRIFFRRAAPFFADNERGKRLQAEWDGTMLRFGSSSANGHFSGRFVLPVRRPDGPGGRLTSILQFATAAGERRPVRLEVHLLEDAGWSVISDIDDTIKVSEVRDKSALIRNTFCRPFQPVPGMAAAYGQWAEGGASFHYLSASPWQLYPALSEFMQSNGFPAGTFHLKIFRAKDSSALGMFGKQTRYKKMAIDELLDRYPHRRFVFVGDSGEQDPEIYGDIARRRSDQVLHVFIRDVTGERVAGTRFRQCFASLSADRWTVFESNAAGAGELTNRLRRGLRLPTRERL